MAENRPPLHQTNDKQRPAPGQQHKERVDRERAGDGLSQGVETGAIQPGKTQGADTKS